MSAQIIRLPVIRKRGRKVTKGPKAEVRVLYYIDDSDDAVEGLDDSLEGRTERLVQLIADGAVRRRNEWAAILAENPQIVEFPERLRYRTLEEVDAHRRFHEDGKSRDDRIDRLAERIANRAKEIIGEQES